MIPVDRTAPEQTAAVSFEFDLAHQPEKVWRALTDPALLGEWLLPVVGFKLELKAPFTYQAPPQPGWDGVVHCRMLAIDPPRRLTYAWLVADMDTVVTFTLTPTPTGTRLEILQSGFREDQKRNWGGARYGWKMMGERLFALLDKTT
jgi:uncharacterized protein YndB with AHSA1/START domain